MWGFQLICWMMLAWFPLNATAKEIYVTYGVDADAVSLWLGTFGGQDSECDISRGMFAGEVGIPRILELFRRFGINATWFIPGHTIETFPDQVRAVVAAGHEIGVHGYSHENPTSMTPDQEEAVMDKCIQLVTKLQGRPPTGYVAPWWEFRNSTVDLLLRKGFRYDHSLMHHDFQPYYVPKGDSWTKINYSRPAETWMKPLQRGVETNLVEIPGSWHLDDIPPLMYIKNAANSHGYVSTHDIERMWLDQFDWIYREYDYAVFAMTIHPDVSAAPHVLMMHERIIAHIFRHPGIHWMTMEEIANDFKKRHPPQS